MNDPTRAADRLIARLAGRSGPTATARLVEDTARLRPVDSGVRGPGPRLLSWDHPEGGLEVEIVDTYIVGQCVLWRGEVRVAVTTGERITVTTIPTDRVGVFQHPLPEGWWMMAFAWGGVVGDPVQR